MKQVFATLLAAVMLFAGRAAATDLVPVSVMQEFFQTFTNAQEVNWEKRNGFNIASFVHNGIKKSAVYDEAGELVTTARQIMPSELSANLQADLKKRFQGFYITTLFEMQDEEGTSYYTTITDGSQEKILKANSHRWVLLKKKILVK